VERNGDSVIVILVSPIEILSSDMQIYVFVDVLTITFLWFLCCHVSALSMCSGSTGGLL
jgi:hypothetical protein